MKDEAGASFLVIHLSPLPTNGFSMQSRPKDNNAAEADARQETISDTNFLDQVLFVQAIYRSRKISRAHICITS